jgi:putative ABC transport system permease protein
MFHLSYRLRKLAKSPATTAAAVITLALGIGASTSIFSVADAVLLRPLPYRDSSRLVMIWDQLNRLGLTRFSVPYAHYLDYRERNRVFDDIAGFEFFDVNLSARAGTDEQPERILAVRATANLFTLLGTPAALGRVFSEQEGQPGRNDAAVLSHALWQRRYGADPDIAGKQVSLNGAPYRVIGVLPENYPLTIATSLEPEVWTPLALRPDPGRGGGTLRLLARLRSSTSLAHARADMLRVAQEIEREFRPHRGPNGEDAGYSIMVAGLREEIYGSLRGAVLVLLSAVALLLSIACANVANLLLARGPARRREIAVRLALGGGRLRVVRELLTESVLLGLAGGAAGVVLAIWGVETLLALGPPGITQGQRVGIDFRVLAFSVMVSVASGIAFGLAPALEGLRADLSETLKSGGERMGPRRSLLRPALVAAEVALSLALLAGAGLLVRSFVKLREVSPGFRTDNVLTLRITLPMEKYREEHMRARFFDEIVERVERLPGVAAAAVVSRLPLSGLGVVRGGDPFMIEGRPYGAGQIVTHQLVSPRYFEAMRIPLIVGRVITPQDTESSEPIAVVNETMARTFWPNESPLGKRILVGAPRPGSSWRRIVGVVADVRVAALHMEPLPQMYEPYRRLPVPSVWLVVRTVSDPMGVLRPVREQVMAIDPDQPVYDVRTMDERAAASMVQARFQSLLMGVFALAALGLASVGIYGVVAHSVSERTQELGIRMALGAQSADVLRLVVGQGMMPVLAGIAAGWIAAASGTRLLAESLFGIDPHDPATFAIVSLLLAAVSLAACILPALKAIRIDPARDLRNE